MDSETLNNEPSTSTSTGSQTLTTAPEVSFIGATINFNVNKTGSLGSLTDRDFALIANPHGWLDGAIIHQAQLCLKKNLIPPLRDSKANPWSLQKF